MCIATTSATTSICSTCSTHASSGCICTATYTANTLTAFRNGTVWGKGANANAIMSAVAANLTDEEIQALATYLQGLHNVADAPSEEAVAASGQPQG